MGVAAVPAQRKIRVRVQALTRSPGSVRRRARLLATRGNATSPTRSSRQRIQITVATPGTAKEESAAALTESLPRVWAVKALVVEGVAPGTSVKTRTRGFKKAHLKVVPTPKRSSLNKNSIVKNRKSRAYLVRH